MSLPDLNQNFEINPLDYERISFYTPHSLMRYQALKNIYMKEKL